MAQEARSGRGARGRHEALLLPHPPVRGAPPGAHGRGRVRAGAGPRHVLRRPRGRARAARAQLPLRPARADRGQHHHVPPDLRRGGPQARPAGLVHAQAVHGRERERAPSPLHADRRRGPQRLPRRERAGAAVGDRAPLPRRAARALPRADVHRQPDGELLLPHVGHRLLGADLQELGLAEPDHDRARRLGRALRVPRRRLLLQPVPDPGGAAARRPRRRAQRDRPRRAAAGQHLRPAPAGRADREGARLARRRAGGAQGRRDRPQRHARAALRGVPALQAGRVGALPGGRDRLGARRASSQAPRTRPCQPARRPRLPVMCGIAGIISRDGDRARSGPR